MTRGKVATTALQKIGYRGTGKRLIDLIKVKQIFHKRTENKVSSLPEVHEGEIWDCITVYFFRYQCNF